MWDEQENRDDGFEGRRVELTGGEERVERRQLRGENRVERRTGEERGYN